jgi:hypothetical protein
MLLEHTDLALKSRCLYLRPVRHVFCSILFVGSSDATYPKPRSNYVLLFTPPSGSNSDNWDRELMVGWSTDPGFQEKLAQTFRATLDDLRHVASIEGLYDRIGPERVEATKKQNGLSHKPVVYACVMAALGQLADAAVIAQNYIAKNERRLLDQLAEGRTLQEQKPKNGNAQYLIDVASHFLKPMYNLRLLADLASSGDNVGVATLLHEWEARNAKRLGLEDAWEPTPFPLELER